jgi:hypothetical protein
MAMNCSFHCRIAVANRVARPKRMVDRANEIGYGKRSCIAAAAAYSGVRLQE